MLFAFVIGLVSSVLRQQIGWEEHLRSDLFCVVVYLCMCAFVLLDLVSSVLCQEIGWEERLRNDLFCVEWEVKP